MIMTLQFQCNGHSQWRRHGMIILIILFFRQSVTWWYLLVCPSICLSFSTSCSRELSCQFLFCFQNCLSCHFCYFSGCCCCCCCCFYHCCRFGYCLTDDVLLTTDAFSTGILQKIRLTTFQTHSLCHSRQLEQSVRI